MSGSRIPAPPSVSNTCRVDWPALASPSLTGYTKREVAVSHRHGKAAMPQNVLRLSETPISHHKALATGAMDDGSGSPQAAPSFPPCRKRSVEGWLQRGVLRHGSGTQGL